MLPKIAGLKKIETVYTYNRFGSDSLDKSVQANSDNQIADHITLFFETAQNSWEFLKLIKSILLNSNLKDKLHTYANNLVHVFYVSIQIEHPKFGQKSSRANIILALLRQHFELPSTIHVKYTNPVRDKNSHDHDAQTSYDHIELSIEHHDTLRWGDKQFFLHPDSSTMRKYTELLTSLSNHLASFNSEGDMEYLNKYTQHLKMFRLSILKFINMAINDTPKAFLSDSDQTNLLIEQLNLKMALLVEQQKLLETSSNKLRQIDVKLQEVFGVISKKLGYVDSLGQSVADASKHRQAFSRDKLFTAPVECKLSRSKSIGDFTTTSSFKRNPQ